LSYFALIAVILGVIGVSLFVYLLRNPILYRQDVQRLRLAVSAIILRSDSFVNPTTERLQRAAEREDTLLGIRVILLHPDGSPIVDSRQGKAPKLPSPTLPLRPQSETQLQPLTLRDASGTPWLYRLGQLDDGNFVMAAVQRPKVALLTLLRDEFSLLVLRTGGVALALGLILGILMARWISTPLQNIARASREVASGNYQPIPMEGPSEVQDLAQAFNEMSARVQASQQSQHDLVANVSHELKTPLTSIQGFAQAILDGTANTPEALRQAATIISTEANRMARLVLDLLTLARLEAGTANLQQEPVDLAATLGAVVDKLAPQAHQAQVDLGIAIQPLPPYTGDRDRLEQVFTNLVDNAIKYTPPGGQVLVRAQPAGGWIEIGVQDTGPGMPVEVSQRIFERFYRADPSRHSSNGGSAGLGLSIAREIVQAQGGTIAVHSAPDQGSHFVVKLPIAKSL
jgi:signal transduction histidine kinase